MSDTPCPTCLLILSFIVWILHSSTPLHVPIWQWPSKRVGSLALLQDHALEVALLVAGPWIWGERPDDFSASLSRLVKPASALILV